MGATSPYAPFTSSVNPMVMSPFEARPLPAGTPDGEPPAGHGGQSDRGPSRTLPWPPAHAGATGGLSPARKGPRNERRKPARAHRLGESAALTDLDQELLLLLTRLRLLSYAQLERRLLRGRSSQAIGQRIRRLVAEGWVFTWDEPTRAGGRPRFVLPARPTLGWAFGRIRSDAARGPMEPLLRFMLPQRPRRPLELAHGAVPPFFHHQRETNDVVLAIESAPSMGALWSSTWERPFPGQAGGIQLPQPDAVLLLGPESQPRLVFLEHDRGMESLAHFRSAKVERYGELSARPELCERLLGFRAFEVWVSVLDKRFRRPLERLTALTGLAVRGGTEELMRFTPAGWLHHDPAGRIWFPPGAAPESSSLRPDDHELTESGPPPLPHGVTSAHEGSAADLTSETRPCGASPRTLTHASQEGIAPG